MLAANFPVTVPIVFKANSTVTALASLLLIGPIGGLVSVRYSLRIEPLRALGLGG
jgi:putative ABC transport system permease protein